MWTIELAFLLFIARRVFPSSLTLFSNSSFPTRSAQLIFSILFHHHVWKSLGICNLLSKVPTFQQRIMLYSICSTEKASSFQTLKHYIFNANLQITDLYPGRYFCYLPCIMLLLSVLQSVPLSLPSLCDTFYTELFWDREQQIRLGRFHKRNQQSLTQSTKWPP